MRTLTIIVTFATLLSACSEESPPELEPPLLRKTVLFDAAVPVSLQSIFDDPDHATLYTVVGDADVGAAGLDVDLADLPRIHDWQVYDQAELSADQTRRLIDTFKTAVIEGEYNGIACFFPHHILRLERKGRILDLVICFKCHNFKVLPEGGYNNVILNFDFGMEEAWREVVATHKLEDFSLKLAENSEEGE